jgi:hypothetical protein
VLLSVADADRARAFVAAGAHSSGSGRTYRGVRLSRYGAVGAAFVGGFLALGQEATLHEAVDLAQGRGRALADGAAFARTTGGPPSDRIADPYATADGRRPTGGGGCWRLRAGCWDGPARCWTARAWRPPRSVAGRRGRRGTRGGALLGAGAA